ncbi:putative Polypyrimidine tract-binding protein [Blattamonas nauphoetae]|uniref:Polypyrimidine tract-binding protein n=1 Tax=Blattamonas nauphoetae TaxID=2049346 RepID=A0ABQ9YG81_9EUKA|nr:putative Polypyrimidine tract-binding protein [Blattamonas nauphoetae]
MATPQTKASKFHPQNPPSPVIHFRNVADQIAQNDLRLLMEPFGTIARILLLSNKNQALVEFTSLNSAQTFINAYRAFPPHIRGTTIYPSFSQHQTLKIDDETQTATDEPGKVLLVSITNTKHPITADVLSAVFSPFDKSPKGTVDKIVIFHRTSGPQAFVQFSSPVYAKSALAELDGKNIYPGCCTLSIQMSELKSVAVQQNSENSVDFTEQKGGLLSNGNTTNHSFGRKSQQSTSYTPQQNTSHPSHSNIIIVSNYPGDQYTIDHLFNVFSNYGYIRQIKILHTKSNTAFIEFTNTTNAQQAVQNLSGLKLNGKTLNCDIARIQTLNDDPSGDSEHSKRYTETRLNRFPARTSGVLKSHCPPTNCLHISGLNDSATEAGLIAHFSPVSPPTGVKIFTAGDKKMGFLQFRNPNATLKSVIVDTNDTRTFRIDPTEGRSIVFRTDDRDLLLKEFGIRYTSFMKYNSLVDVDFPITPGHHLFKEQIGLSVQKLFEPPKQCHRVKFASFVFYIPKSFHPTFHLRETVPADFIPDFGCTFQLSPTSSFIKSSSILFDSASPFLEQVHKQDVNCLFTTSRTPFHTAECVGFTNNNDEHVEVWVLPPQNGQFISSAVNLRSTTEMLTGRISTMLQMNSIEPLIQPMSFVVYTHDYKKKVNITGELASMFLWCAQSRAVPPGRDIKIYYCRRSFAPPFGIYSQDIVVICYGRKGTKYEIPPVIGKKGVLEEDDEPESDAEQEDIMEPPFPRKDSAFLVGVKSADQLAPHSIPSSMFNTPDAITRNTSVASFSPEQLKSHRPTPPDSMNHDALPRESADSTQSMSIPYAYQSPPDTSGEHSDVGSHESPEKMDPNTPETGDHTASTPEHGTQDTPTQQSPERDSSKAEDHAPKGALAEIPFSWADSSTTDANTPTAEAKKLDTSTILFQSSVSLLPNPTSLSTDATPHVAKAEPAPKLKFTDFEGIVDSFHAELMPSRYDKTYLAAMTDWMFLPPEFIDYYNTDELQVRMTQYWKLEKFTRNVASAISSSITYARRVVRHTHFFELNNALPFVLPNDFGHKKSKHGRQKPEETTVTIETITQQQDSEARRTMREVGQPEETTGGDVFDEAKWERKMRRPTGDAIDDAVAVKGADKALAKMKAVAQGIANKLKKNTQAFSDAFTNEERLERQNLDLTDDPFKVIDSFEKMIGGANGREYLIKGWGGEEGAWAKTVKKEKEEEFSVRKAQQSEKPEFGASIVSAGASVTSAKDADGIQARVKEEDQVKLVLRQFDLLTPQLLNACDGGVASSLCLNVSKREREAIWMDRVSRILLMALEAKIVDAESPHEPADLFDLICLVLMSDLVLATPNNEVDNQIRLKKQRERGPKYGSKQATDELEGEGKEIKDHVDKIDGATFMAGGVGEDDEPDSESNSATASLTESNSEDSDDTKEKKKVSRFLEKQAKVTVMITSAVILPINVTLPKRKRPPLSKEEIEKRITKQKKKLIRQNLKEYKMNLLIANGLLDKPPEPPNPKTMSVDELFQRRRDALLNNEAVERNRGLRKPPVVSVTLPFSLPNLKNFDFHTRASTAASKLLTFFLHLRFPGETYRAPESLRAALSMVIMNEQLTKVKEQRDDDRFTNQMRLDVVVNEVQFNEDMMISLLRTGCAQQMLSPVFAEDCCRYILNFQQHKKDRTAGTLDLDKGPVLVDEHHPAPVSVLFIQFLSILLRRALFHVDMTVGQIHAYANAYRELHFNHDLDEEEKAPLVLLFKTLPSPYFIQALLANPRRFNKSLLMTLCEVITKLALNPANRNTMCACGILSLLITFFEGQTIRTVGVEKKNQKQKDSFSTLSKLVPFVTPHDLGARCIFSLLLAIHNLILNNIDGKTEVGTPEMIRVFISLAQQENEQILAEVLILLRLIADGGPTALSALSQFSVFELCYSVMRSHVLPGVRQFLPIVKGAVQLIWALAPNPQLRKMAIDFHLRSRLGILLQDRKLPFEIAEKAMGAIERLWESEEDEEDSPDDRTKTMVLVVPTEEIQKSVDEMNALFTFDTTKDQDGSELDQIVKGVLAHFHRLSIAHSRFTSAKNLPPEENWGEIPIFRRLLRQILMCFSCLLQIAQSQTMNTIAATEPEAYVHPIEKVAKPKVQVSRWRAQSSPTPEDADEEEEEDFDWQLKAINRMRDLLEDCTWSDEIHSLATVALTHTTGAEKMTMELSERVLQLSDKYKTGPNPKPTVPTVQENPAGTDSV